LINPATGQKVVDYIQVTFEPMGDVPSKAAPRDFRVADVLLHIVVPPLRIKNEAVPLAIVADMVVNRGLVWLSVAGRGRFLLSLAPQDRYEFKKAGAAGGRTLTLTDRRSLRVAHPSGRH
jgi:hypothetical protein